jgi:hypothetical protein
MITTPMTPDQWQSQLKKFRVPFREVPGWDLPKSGRDDETGKIFGPMFGGVQHHTGSDASDSNNRFLIIRGRSNLPGPLAQGGVADDGMVDLITCHRANHAGGGDPDVLAAVKAASYSDYPPHTDKHEGEAGAADGNDCFYGLEAYYYRILTPVMYRSMIAWWAAICDFHGWNAKHVIGHKEWSDWKPDPNLIDMRVFRKDIDALIASVNAALEGPKWLTPNISKALVANIQYDKALAAIKLPSLQDDLVLLRGQVKQQRRILRVEERK